MVQQLVEIDLRKDPDAARETQLFERAKSVCEQIAPGLRACVRIHVCARTRAPPRYYPSVGGYEGFYEFESSKDFYNRVWVKLGLIDGKKRGRYKEKLSDCTCLRARRHVRVHAPACKLACALVGACVCARPCARLRVCARV